MQKITPNLWFEKDTSDAVSWYVSIFPNSKITNHYFLYNTPSNTAELITFEVLGYEIVALGAGPMFNLNPSVSLLVTCTTKDQVDEYWKKLSQGGKALMELGAYPFGERYVWVEDKYGLSWQLMYSNEANARQMIRPVVMFVGDVAGKAEEAINSWTSVFPNSKINDLMRYEKGEEPDKAGTIKFGSFTLFGQEFAAMDSAHEHKFGFSEGISFIINCDTQEEIDQYWEKLSAVPEAEICGWLKDKFGFSWQVSPTRMLDKLLAGTDREKIDRLTQTLLEMSKLDIAKLQAAYDGE
jgi:predicted 3-demethylubiquinone-9 3-methyltransferase (glyoxalase superfamily)